MLVAFNTPPLNSTCVGQASPLGPRRTAPCSALDACCRRNFAMCRVIAASAAYGNPISCNPTRRCAVRHFRARDSRQKSFAAARGSMSSRSSDALMVPPTRPVPLPRIVTGCSFAFESGSSSFSFAMPALAARAREAAELIELRALLGKPLRHHAGERQIHVVAAEQNMLADRDAFQRQFAALVRDRDQREVRGAAADIDDQNQIADRDLLTPVRMAFDPGVEGGLRLFEQDDVL